MSNSQTPGPGAELNSIVNMLERLHIFHTAQQCKKLLDRAALDNLSHQDFLFRLLDGELAFRHENRRPAHPRGSFPFYQNH